MPTLPEFGGTVAPAGKAPPGKALPPFTGNGRPALINISKNLPAPGPPRELYPPVGVTHPNIRNTPFLSQFTPSARAQAESLWIHTLPGGQMQGNINQDWYDPQTRAIQVGQTDANAPDQVALKHEMGHALDAANNITGYSEDDIGFSTPGLYQPDVRGSSPHVGYTDPITFAKLYPKAGVADQRNMEKLMNVSPFAAYNRAEFETNHPDVPYDSPQFQDNYLGSGPSWGEAYAVQGQDPTTIAPNMRQFYPQYKPEAFNKPGLDQRKVQPTSNNAQWQSDYWDYQHPEWRKGASDAAYKWGKTFANPAHPPYEAKTGQHWEWRPDMDVGKGAHYWALVSHDGSELPTQ